MFKKIVVLVFILFFCGIGFLNLIKADQRVSEHENRVLASRPEFTLQGFISGDFMEDFEEYINDQFIGKTSWLKGKALIEKMTLKQENNGIFIGKNDYLLQPISEPTEQMQRNINSINSFSEKNEDVSMYFLLAPTSVDIYREQRPWLAQSYNQLSILNTVQKQLSTNISFIDVYETLRQNNNQQLYFRTDHHWTARGAYFAYVEAAKAMELQAYSMNDFNVETVSENFKGTFYSKANALNVQPDYIEAFFPKWQVDYNVLYDQKESTKSLYEYSYLKKRDQYSFFLDGNHSLVKIASSVKNGRKLAVVKDSYAHIFIPFLVNHFEEVHVIDLRFNQSNLSDYLVKNEIKDVLFLYNIDQFMTDKNFIWLQQ